MKKLCKYCNKVEEFSLKGKACKVCKSKYDKENFLKNRSSILNRVKDYNQSNKSHKKEYDRNYRAKNKDKILSEKKLRKESGKSYIEARRSSIKRKYKISLEEYDLMLKNQDGKCKICGATESEHKSSVLYVDHNHLTGKIRGLLCHHCNFGLGGFRDNKEFLLNAVKYLDEFNS